MSPKSQKKKSRYLNRFKSRPIRAAEKPFDGQKGDVIVAVMGPTGVGKSTFVKSLIEGHAAPSVSVKIGHDLESCTSELQPIPLPFKGLSFLEPKKEEGRLVIVDTPGFDDTYTKDSEILQRIAEWLAVSYSQNVKLGGVIYLHDISQPRMLGTFRKNLDMFSKLCGRDAWKSVLLATTKWDEVQKEAGVKREKQLKEKFWPDMLENGAQVRRCGNDSKSAWDIVQHFLEKTNAHDKFLKIQEELVEMEKIIPATDAGKQLRYTIEEVLKMMQNAEQGDVQGAERQKLLEKLTSQIDQLKIPLLYRLKRIFSLQ